MCGNQLPHAEAAAAVAVDMAILLFERDRFQIEQPNSPAERRLIGKAEAQKVDSLGAEQRGFV